MSRSIATPRGISRVFWACSLTVLALACEGAMPAPPAPPASDGNRAGGSGGGQPSPGTGGKTTTPSPGTGGVTAVGSGGAGAGGAGGTRADAGVVPEAGGVVPPRDLGSSAPEAGAAPDGGTTRSAALDQHCTVPVTFTNNGMGNPGATIFTTSFPDAVATMQAHARAICRILYRKPEEVRVVKQQRLVLEPSTEIAFTAGASITFSTDYISEFARGKTKAAIDAELNGVLVHEGAHVWQYTNGGGALVEAMADYVRYKAGFYTLARRSRGGNWDQPYTTGGFFIAWVEEKYDPDYGYKLNMGMKDRGFSYPTFVQQVTRKPIATVWAEYQAAIR
jgi:hypothetical protein